MTIQHSTWAYAHPWHVAAAAATCLAGLTAVVWLLVRRVTGAVFAAGVGALVCTVYSADTSWRFAEHRLDMADTSERVIMFAAGEVALIVCAVMARANKRATATEDSAGTPGVPGVLVWGITGAQIIPAFAESGMWGGLIRATFGPVMAGLLWHLAMGLEIRVSRPTALSTGLPAQIGHELRERLLSYLGLAMRNRTAEQISRDRATARAVRLASRRRLGPWGRSALAASVARSGAALDGHRRHELLQLLAGRRSAAELRTVPVTSPWHTERAPEAYPRTPLGVTGAELRHMDPLDAVARVHAAHPDRTPAEVAALCTEYGVPVSETQVRVALRAGNPARPAEVHPVPALPATPAPHPAGAPAPAPVLASGVPAPDLHLDIRTEPRVRHEFACAVPVEYARTRAEVRLSAPAGDAPLEHPADPVRRRTAEEPAAHPHAPRTRTPEQPAPGAPGAGAPGAGAPGAGAGTPSGAPSAPGADPLDDLLEQARAVDAAHRRTHGRHAGLRTLKAELGVGQVRAQALRTLLDDARAVR
ncbi:hypothetical protein [Streptomyces aureocirculatus]|uniref:hypothetical protein n=1 Tax=Streptomyces aureocirculatus TaxID=67275 RepID=UPI0006894A92|nr:hypothetical protein [Streptomyces aureocirculatus]